MKFDDEALDAAMAQRFDHPRPRSFTITVELAPLHVAAGLYAATATLRHRESPTTYWLRGIVGPDGVMIVDRFLAPARDAVPIIGRRDTQPRHDYTEAEIAAEIRREYAERAR